MKAWSSGSRRRGSSQPKLIFLRLGDLFGAINVRAPGRDQLSVRSWRPRSGEEWIADRPYSLWGAADVGLTTDSWSSFPKRSVNRLGPHVFPLEDTGIVINFRIFLASPAMAQSYAKAGCPPPPPPARPERSWGYGTGSANYGYRRDQENEAALQESSALQVLTGAALISSPQGYS